MRIAILTPQTSSSVMRSASNKRIVTASSAPRPVQQPCTHANTVLNRRSLLASAVVIGSALSGSRAAEAARDNRVNKDFIELPSGVLVQDILEGKGPEAKAGDTVVVDWSGYTKGYQGKVIGNSTKGTAEPFEFKIGGGQAIKAFDDAVLGMKVGGVRRVEVPGEKEELGYPRDRSLRFLPDLAEGKPFQYRLGPQPIDLGGQRAVDFVLDNETLRPFNRTLLFDIRLVAVRPGRK